MATEPMTGVLIDPLADKPGYQLRRASLVYLADLTFAIEALGLRVTEAIFLLFVGSNPDCNQADISRSLGVKRTNMVPTVNQLTKLGLLVRRAADGRTNALSLTADGEKLRAALLEIVDRCEAQFFGDIEPERMAPFLDILLRIRSKGED